MPKAHAAGPLVFAGATLTPISTRAGHAARRSSENLIAGRAHGEVPAELHKPSARRLVFVWARKLVVRLPALFSASPSSTIFTPARLPLSTSTRKAAPPGVVGMIVIPGCCRRLFMHAA